MAPSQATVLAPSLAPVLVPFLVPFLAPFWRPTTKAWPGTPPMRYQMRYHATGKGVPAGVMIVLFTDFGLHGPYTGQLEAALERDAPGVRVVRLFSDAPAHDPRRAAYLLAAYVDEFPDGTVFLSVVDPGVGGPRAPAVLTVDGRWYVGPENGLFELVVRRARSQARWWEISWRPERLSETFHGRDLFAPVAARIAAGESVDENADFRARPIDDVRRVAWPDDLAEIVYIDGFGNAMTGLRASRVPAGAGLAVSGQTIGNADKFDDVGEGEPFWYENANGLAEIAVNRGRADACLGLRVGSQVAVSKM